MMIRFILRLPKKVLKKIVFMYRLSDDKKDYKRLYKTISDKGIMDENLNACDERNKRLSCIIKYSLSHVPYYRSVYKGPKKINANNVLDCIKKFPVLKREDIYKYNKELKSNIAFIYPQGVSKTSGTTGIPLEFIASSPNGEIGHQTFLYEFMTGEKPDFDRIVSFGGAYLSEELTSKKIFWTERNKGDIYGSVLFSSFYLLEDNIPIIVKKLESINPQIIRSYPSALLLFIDLCEKLKIEPKVNVKGIYVTSENSTKEQLNRISSFFNCGVYGQYGHSEACVFAFTLKNDTTYYCSPFYGFVEVLNDKDEHVKVGETGYVTVTTFRNRAMPFIRYRMGDLAVYGGEKNGYVILEKIIGRSQDYILNCEEEKIFLQLNLMDAHRTSCVSKIITWQAIQEKKGFIDLKLVKKDSFTKEDEEEIVQLLKRNKIDATIEYVDDIPLTKAGKRKYILNSLY